MPNYFNSHLLHGVQDELRKLAIAVPWQSIGQGFTRAGQAIQRGAGAVGTGAGMGAVAGGLVGAGIGGVRHYKQERQQGQGVLGSALHSAGAALHGGVTGAAVGAGAGAVGGVAAHNLVSPGKLTGAMQAARDLPVLGHGARFGQSQAHLLTGWKPQGGLEQLGVGATRSRQNLNLAQQRIENLRAAQRPVPGMDTIRQHLEQMAGKATSPAEAEHIQKVLEAASAPVRAPEQQSLYGQLRGRLLGHERDTAWRLGSAQREEARLQRAVAAGTKAEEMGLTSIPGYVQSLVRNPWETISTAAKQRWNEQGLAGKGLLLGLPLAMGVSDVMRDDPERSRASRALNAAGNIASGFAFAPMNMVGDMAMSLGTAALADKAGKGFDRHVLRLGAKPPGTEQEEHNLSAPVERIESSRFRGEAPEGGVA